MFDLLKLKAEVSETTDSIEPDDVLSVKNKLKGLNYYKEPEWGMTKFTDDGMFAGIRKFQTDNKLKIDGVMKPKGETETTFNKILRKGEYASSAAQQGLSLGWADEAEGVMGGVGYGIGSLKKSWNKTGESFSEAYNRGYKKHRDERRGILKEGYEKAPILMGVSEAIGAGLSPIKFTKISQTAPLNVIKRKNLLDAISNGSVYGIGISENNAQDYAKNIGLGIMGNYGGRTLGEKLYGRGNNRPAARALMSGVSGKTVSSIYDTFKKNKE